MYYAITHLTIYQYSQPITDSVMELRLHPRNDGQQRCIRFQLDIRPKVKHFSYRDYLGNVLHSFNIPGAHNHMALKSEAVVEVKSPIVLPDALSVAAWDELDAHTRERELYDMVLPSHFTQPSVLLTQFANEIGWGRAFAPDPLTALRGLNSAIYTAFEYQQHVTKVDSPIDVALESRSGVCQDFTHIMLALTRQIGIPSRYVSGYLFHRADKHDRSDADASHAWVECWLPSLGWVGFDPTNNLMVTDRHIRVSVGSDYASASPTRGVYHGITETSLAVQVKVAALDNVPEEEQALAPEMALPPYEYGQATLAQQQSQQQ
jgi:transglutaminase-like putative cysteine protease